MLRTILLLAYKPHLRRQMLEQGLSEVLATVLEDENLAIAAKAEDG